MKRARSFAILALSLAPSVVLAQEWPTHDGDLGASKYSRLARVDRTNASRLTLAWTWETNEKPIPSSRTTFPGRPLAPGKFQGTPVLLGDTLYITTSFTRVAALDAETGAEKWSFDPRAYDWGPLPRGCGFCHRGVAVWTDGKEVRVFINTRWRLIALDGLTGEPVAGFGQRGEVDMTEGLIWEVNPLHYTHTSPPLVFGNLVISGSGMPDNRVYHRNPPGDVQAFDVRTGERVWSFHTVPQEGEFGNDTWEDGSWSYTGSTNVWGPFSIDAERGLVYLPIGTPNNDFYGGHRKGDNLFAESIVCLDARTGKRVWHFQTVRHGVWDYDLPAPPNLVDIEVGGRKIAAVAVVAKTGFTYVFDRVTGEPVWPIEDRPVPASDVPGERLSKTQPYPTKPPPFIRQAFTEDDLIDFTPEVKAKALKAVEGYRLGAMFDPPSLEGTVILPGVWGGANWGGAAFDPETALLYVRSIEWPFIFKLEKPEPGTADADYVIAGAPPLEVEGLPIHKPPYATLTAIDLNRGEHAWQVPFGDMPSMKSHPLLQGVDIPPTGEAPPQHGQAGPLVTAGGLLFLASASPYLYVFDKANGKELHRIELDGGFGFGSPMTYLSPSGRQIVVVATSKSQGEDAKLMAFALPRELESPASPREKSAMRGKE
jgi:quinoprotein glucose dehydrogenase